jgi:hypothetical protein
MSAINRRRHTGLYSKPESHEKMSIRSHVEMIGDAAKKAILEYAQMANTSEEPPESFIQHFCALELYRKTAWNVRIEFPARHVSGWNIDRSKFKHLSRDFRIDLVCFRQAGGLLEHLEMLVEFKRWTVTKDIEVDLNRLREIRGLVANGKSGDPQIGIYSVCVPHYSTLAEVEVAISNLENHYRTEHSESFMTREGTDRGAAGIIILDANNCLKG